MNPLLPYNAFITHMAAQPTLPSFYWQVYSYEQRIKEICIRLQRCILYNDYTVENVNQLIDFVNNLSTRVDELNDQIQDVNKRLLEEIERATAAEEEITNNLNAEIARAKAAEAELSTRIDKVSADLATETARAKAAEEELDGKITAEVNRATAKENQLQTAIDNEVSRATAKENELDTAIKAETQRAEQVEAKLSSDITAESQRAYQVEQQIKSDLTAEINRATAREDALEAKIDDIPSGMEFPDYSTFKTLSIEEGEGANIKDVTPDVDGYMLLWCTTTVSQETDRAVYISVPSGPSWANIAKFPVAPNTENNTGALGTPIPVKSGTKLRISLPATVTLQAVRHFYKAS